MGFFVARKLRCVVHKYISINKISVLLLAGPFSLTGPAEIRAGVELGGNGICRVLETRMRAKEPTFQRVDLQRRRPLYLTTQFLLHPARR